MTIKAEELIDDCIQHPNLPIVIELPNGQRWPTNSYHLSTNERGQDIIVIQAGKRQ